MQDEVADGDELRAEQPERRVRMEAGADDFERFERRKRRLLFSCPLGSADGEAAQQFVSVDVVQSVTERAPSYGMPSSFLRARKSPAETACRLSKSSPKIRHRCFRCGIGWNGR